MGKIIVVASDEVLQNLNIALQAALLEKDNPLAAHARGVYIIEDRKEEGTFHVRSLEGAIATFALKQLPGCCGVVVSYYSELLPELRKKGIGQQLLSIRMSAARRLKYGAMLATVLDSNTAENKLLVDAGWTLRGETRNPKTGNIVKTYMVNL